MNTITLIGNLTKDPVIRQYEVNGEKYPCIQFSVACNKKKKGEVNFFDCVLFGKTVEVFKTYFGKGSPVYLQGRLEQNKDRNKVSIVVESFSFVPRGTYIDHK